MDGCTDGWMYVVVDSLAHSDLCTSEVLSDRGRPQVSTSSRALPLSGVDGTAWRGVSHRPSSLLGRVSSHQQWGGGGGGTAKTSPATQTSNSLIEVGKGHYLRGSRLTPHAPRPLERVSRVAKRTNHSPSAERTNQSLSIG